MSQLAISADCLALIRHGSTSLNERAVLLSSQDPGLSVLGQSQSSHLASWAKPRLRDWHVVSSPSRRAMETAQYLVPATASGDQVVFADALRERNLGPYEGLGANDLRSQRAAAGLGILDMTLVWDGAEQVEQDSAIVDRVCRGLADLALTGRDGAGVSLVTHAGVIKALLHAVLDIPSSRPYAFRIGLGSVAILQRQRSVYWELKEFWQNPAATDRYLD